MESSTIEGGKRKHKLIVSLRPCDIRIVVPRVSSLEAVSEGCAVPVTCAFPRIRLVRKKGPPVFGRAKSFVSHHVAMYRYICILGNAYT